MILPKHVLGRPGDRRVGLLEIRKENDGNVMIEFALIAPILIVLIMNILDFSLLTGHRLHSRSVPPVPGAGVCGIRPCLPTSLRMVDASHGLVAYTLSGKLHLLRLRDGRNRVVARATDARFGDTGLFYTYTTTGPYPGRIRFVPWRNLPLRP